VTNEYIDCSESEVVPYNPVLQFCPSNIDHFIRIVMAIARQANPT